MHKYDCVVQVISHKLFRLVESTEILILDEQREREIRCFGQAAML